MGGGITNNGIADIKFLGRMVWRNSNGLQNLLASDDSVRALRGDIQGRDGDAGFVGDGL